MKNKKTAIVLAGGFGKRLKSITKKTPKPLIKFFGKSFLEYIIDNLIESNFNKIYIITYYKYKQFETIFNIKNPKYKNIYIKCIKEKRKLGTGGALLSIKNYPKNFYVINGDTFFDINLKSNEKFNNKYYGKIFFTKNSNYKSNKKLSNLSLNSKNLVIKKNSTIMNGGIYYFSNKIITILKKFYRKKQKPFSIENDILYNILIPQKKIYGEYKNSIFVDIGLKKNIFLAKKIFNKKLKNKIFFLDRDGVINEDLGYVYKKKDFRWTKGIFEGLKIIRNKGFEIIIVTNQSGIGRGLFKERDFHNLNNWMLKKIESKGIKILDVFYCPYHPKYGKGIYKKRSYDRKPNPGMLIRAIKKYNVDVKNSYMIGDQDTDMIAAKRAGIKFLYKNKRFNFKSQLNKIL